MAQQAFRKYARDHLAEPHSRSCISHCFLPTTPCTGPGLLWKSIPKFRAVLYSLAAVSSVLAACSAIGIRNVLRIIAAYTLENERKFSRETPWNLASSRHRGFVE